MTNIEGKIKKWIQLIQTEKLDIVRQDIQVNVLPNLKEKVNKHIFKLLLYLSHTADKCDKQNCTIGKEIHKLTCLLCSLLIEIPDSNKFVSSLFHIVRCLLVLCMYKEASDVCAYLETEALCYSHANVSDILIKIAYLWYNAVNNAFLILQKDPLNVEYYYELKDIIKHELQIIEITHKNYTKHLLVKISLYLDKIASINKEPNTCFTDFYVFIIEYLNLTKIFLNEDEKYVISRQMLHIVSKIACENVNEKCLKSVIEVLDTLSNYFKTTLKEDEECYQCFQQFQSLYHVLMKPVECLVENNAKSIHGMCDNYVKIAKQYGYKGCIKWMTFSIVQVLEPLFMYWETCIKTGKKLFLENGILLEVMNLVAHINICFIKQRSDKCKSCQNKDCMVKRDIYNAVVIKIRCVNLISKLATNDLSQDICRLARKFLEQNIAYIYEMKECKCKCWMYLWSTCSALIYNLGIMSECIYEESVSLFSLLCTSIIQFEGVQQKSQYINLQNPICFTLHRLCSLHYNHGMYREAMTVSALNALLSYNDSNSKAFRMWANIKHKSMTSKEIMEMTILTCLKSDKAKIEELGFSIELSQYELVEICLREAKGLQEAKVNLSGAIYKVLDEMTILDVTPIQYARVVQMLVYHLLNFDYEKDTLDCLKYAISILKQLETNNSVLCLQANLEFYTFVSQLHTISKKTQMEMENTRFALHAPKLSEIGENESRDVVPAYTMINIKEDCRLEMYLQAPLKKWNKCLVQNIEEIAKNYEPMITLHTLIIAGEYAHLYRYQECEINIWKLAYKLAFKLQDNRAIIYVTGRSITLRHINHKWITIAKELAIKLKDTNDEDLTYAIAIFWISLSDFYFECNIFDEARNLLNESRKLSGISFFSNVAVYLYSLDRILYNCYLYKEEITHEEYVQYIVETLYTMVNLNEELLARKWKHQDKHLFGFDILLSATVNLSLRMNSLLSFREIGAHLVRRLKTAQTLGATIRVAEILKSLCYIDLSRSQLSDCEVKLQALEHILNIETFTASMNNNSTKAASENVLLTPIRAVDPIRDIPQNDASPILKNKVFDLPEFLCHTDCNCYVCQNVSYHYLVLTSTHIRAQLYALQQNFAASLQHFHGAFKINKSLMKTVKIMLEEKRQYLTWKQDKIINTICLAIQLCDIYKLKGHPIYMSVKELMLDNRFQKIFDSIDYSTFTVPESSNINISKYVQTFKTEETICFTPTINNINRTKKPITLRRNRTPPLLKLTKVSMNFSDDEDNNSSPPSGQRRTKLRSKLTKRKILDAEYSNSIGITKEETEQAQHRLLSEEFIDIKKNNFNNISIMDILNKVASLVPDVSEYLFKAVDKVDEPATNKNIQKLIKRIEDLKMNALSQKDFRKTRHLKQITMNDCNKFNQVIALFKDLAVNEQKDNIDLPNNNDSMSEHNTASVSSIKIHKVSHQNLCRINKKNNTEKSEENNLSVEQYNKVGNIKKTCASENTRLRITRKSSKHVITKETDNAKNRKSKEKSC
ncbi:uncharacterized protein LOC143148617 isoform X2 [Ptiloglossa arizonensis]|uniref:uncharacterized protein LOC143148617 isoform X2 n=1 Tax=Ptiloglossa arizonensis TaxID=3350558 RepID=UPI003F9F615D